MRLGILTIAEQGVHQRAQMRCQFHEGRRENETFKHVDDGMRLQRVEADLDCAVFPGHLEHGAPPRARRHGDDVRHVGVTQSEFRQCTDDVGARARAIF